MPAPPAMEDERRPSPWMARVGRAAAARSDPRSARGSHPHALGAGRARFGLASWTGRFRRRERSTSNVAGRFGGHRWGERRAVRGSAPGAWSRSPRGLRRVRCSHGSKSDSPPTQRLALDGGFSHPWRRRRRASSSGCRAGPKVATRAVLRAGFPSWGPAVDNLGKGQSGDGGRPVDKNSSDEKRFLLPRVSAWLISRDGSSRYIYRRASRTQKFLGAQQGELRLVAVQTSFARAVRCVIVSSKVDRVPGEKCVVRVFVARRAEWGDSLRWPSGNGKHPGTRRGQDRSRGSTPRWGPWPGAIVVEIPARRRSAG
jgi:hypothetical protein